MTRRANNQAVELDLRDTASVLAAILADGLPAGCFPELVEKHRAMSPDAGAALTLALAQEVRERCGRLAETTQILEGLQQLVEKLQAAPWFPATVVDTTSLDRTGHVLVAQPGGQRLVAVADEVDGRELAAGDPVYLSRGCDMLMATAPPELVFGGDMASYERDLPDGRLVARVRDEEVLLRRGRALRSTVFHRGSLLRFDRAAQLALEDVGEQAEASTSFFTALDETPVRVGGARLRSAVDRLVEALTARLVAPAEAARFGLHARRAILLSGPPGVGKTMSVRAAIQQLQVRSGRRCRFAVVRPSEWESPWVGSTEAAIRATFARLAHEAGEDLAVLFLDEIESIGRVRGASMSRHADKFLAALLVEIDGLVRRGNIAVIAATNRKDMLDPALLERIGEIDIEVARPDLEGAREIFSVHLDEGLPYAGGDATRQRMIESAVSMLYAPNADNLVATVHFRDGKTRPVPAKEMISGRLIEQVCHRVRESGFRRSVSGAVAALDVADVRQSIGETLDRLRSTLTTHNIRAWVDDLPADIDIVRVAAEKPSVVRPYRYLRVA